MTDTSEMNVRDSVVMGSVINNSQIYNLIIASNPKEWADKVDEMFVPQKTKISKKSEIQITLKSQIEDFKQKNDDKVLPTNLAKLLLVEGQSEINDAFLQRVIAQDIHESFWILFGNLMIKNGEDYYSEYHLEKQLLREAIDSAKYLCISALKMNSESFGVLCKVRSMSVLCMTSALDGDIELAEKYGIEAINIWEKYGDDYFSKCGYPINKVPIMSEHELDLFYEFQIVYGAYHQILVNEKPSGNRIRKFFRHLDAHPASIFRWSVDPSIPMWTVISGLPEFSELSKFETKKHYEYWASQAKIQNYDDDLMLLQEILDDLD